MAKTDNVYDASSITVLEGLEAVRKRPGMYIGSVSTKGLNHLIYEIVDNSVDEHLAGVCSEIRVTLEKDGSATISDNGRGIPVGMHQKGVSAERVVFTTLHAGGKFDNSAYKTSGGLHGVGSSVVNALSTQLTVTVRSDGLIHQDKYEYGNPVIELVDGLLPVIGKTKETGTTINFTPDPSIFDRTRFKAEDVKSRLHETAYLNPKLTIIFSDLRGEEPEVITYSEPEGIIGYVKDLNKNKETLHDIIYFTGVSENITVECAFQYVNEFHENVLGFCNNIYNAEGGTHLTGFKTMFTTIINNYARELNILKEKDVNFTGADVRNGMTAVVSIKHPAPRFEGQTKTKLDNQDASKAVSKVTGDEVPHYFDRNVEVLKSVISCAEKAAKIRKTEEKAKTNMLTKQKFSFDSNGKLANCESKDYSKCEIFIVEGDSAGGKDCAQQKLSGDPADPRKDPQRREGKHRQGAGKRRDQDDDQRLWLRLFGRLRQRLRHFQAPLQQDRDHGGCRRGRRTHQQPPAHAFLPFYAGTDLRRPHLHRDAASVQGNARKGKGRVPL